MNRPKPGAAAQALLDRGLALHQAGDLEAAQVCYKTILQRTPRHFDAAHLLGLILAQIGRPELGVSLMTRAIDIDPGVATVHSNLAAALNDIGRHQDALDHADRAVALDPSFAAAFNNQGLARFYLHNDDAALASFDRAIALQPGYAQAVFNRGVARLRQGELELGWPDHELRGRAEGHAWRDFDARRLWLGEGDIAGRRLFVYAEQGLGDTIQFCRYLPLLEARGARVIVSIQDSLMGLVGRLSTTLEVVGEAETPARYDLQCPLLSLPLALGTTLRTVPPQAPPLRATADRRAGFEGLIEPRIRPRVGLAWSGNPKHRNDRRRSIRFETLAPLLLADVDWFVLQTDRRAEDLAALRKAAHVRDLGERLSDFDDTAALLDLMDLVITVDTSLAHLAGAMGKPVWILLPFNPDWRWLLERTDSPWYPSARLFRQSRVGDWGGVVARLGVALDERFRDAGQDS